MINIEKLVESKRVEITFADIDIDKEFVKAFRTKNHLTQIALANIFGVKKKTVEKWEQGVNRIGGSSAVLFKLLDANPELLSQLYTVRIGVIGKPLDNDYKNVDSAEIKAPRNPAALIGVSKLPLVAMI